MSYLYTPQKPAKLPKTSNRGFWILFAMFPLVATATIVVTDLFSV